MKIGDKISLLRKQRGLTIDELAEKSNVPKGTLNKIISGDTKDPQLSTVKALAAALICSLDDLDDYVIATEARPANVQGISISVTEQENQLLQNYRSLNEEGQEKATDYITLLVKSDDYKKLNSPSMATETQQA